jgi:membrane-associated phospholipid phosphatase
MESDMTRAQITDPELEELADRAAPLDTLLVDAALGSMRRPAPNSSKVRFAAQLARHPVATGRRLGSLAAELAWVGVGTSTITPSKVELIQYRPQSQRVREIPPSFPSGHAAPAFAFASAVGRAASGVRLPLRVAAATVDNSRVHTGLHLQSDVAIGAAVGELCDLAVRRLETHWAGVPQRGGDHDDKRR